MRHEQVAGTQVRSARVLNDTSAITLAASNHGVRGHATGRGHLPSNAHRSAQRDSKFDRDSHIDLAWEAHSSRKLEQALKSSLHDFETGKEEVLA
eukprot:3923920-Rhodomonas_salina.1